MKNHTIKICKRLSLLLFTALFLAVTLIGCGPESTSSETASTHAKTGDKSDTSTTDRGPVPEYTPDPDHGSAVTMQGKTLLISIFTTDRDTSWNFDSSADKELIEETHEKLRIAADFLHGQAACLDKEFSLVYDWEESDGLMYKANIDESLVRYDADGYTVQKNWIEENIDVSALMYKYKADGVIFVFYFNTDASNEINSWELSDLNGVQLPLEICNFYLKFDNQDMPASSFAHEIMHTFGAKDLYYPNEGIPEEFVKYLEETGSSDIMFTVFDNEKIIVNDFTELDAYYVGIAPRPDIADEWNLALSEHESN